jgi:ubiquitin-conjugating enzyme E2 S
LHTAGLPPNYLFPPSSSSDPSSDLTVLDVLLAGPIGTPYAAGVWRLHLDIPHNYPTAPPTATFHTRLWHPNIDENTGAVCVETLKRDWSSSLKLRDVLVTISCLLIQPNPASALNEAAGKLASEDWDGFCRRARLMTQIHAGIPESLAKDVKEAQMRGEEPDKQDKSSEVVDKGKGKARASVGAPTATPSLLAEDEENRRRRGDTVEVESDPESDWIPGPTKIPKSFGTGRDNVFGIKGLSASPAFGTPLKDDEMAMCDDTGLTQSSDLQPSNSFTLRVPPGPSPVMKAVPAATSSDQTGRAPTDPESKLESLLREFSWSWQDTQILHSTGFTSTETSKSDVLKRMAGPDFQERQDWERKRFKQAGYDLDRYNRGDWGPRTGIFRL